MEHFAPSPSAAHQQSGLAETSFKNEAYSSGVSWAAVIGGAFVAAALSLILLGWARGFGLSSVSPGERWRLGLDDQYSSHRLADCYANH